MISLKRALLNATQNKHARNPFHPHVCAVQMTGQNFPQLLQQKFEIQIFIVLFEFSMYMHSYEYKQA